MLNNNGLKLLSSLLFMIFFVLYVLLVVNTQGSFWFIIIVSFLYLFSYIFFFNKLFFLFVSDKDRKGRTVYEAREQEKRQIGFALLIPVFIISLLCLILSSTNKEIEATIETKLLKYGRFHHERKWEIHLNNNYYYDTDYQLGFSLLEGDRVSIGYKLSWFGVIHFNNKYVVKRGETPIQYTRWESEWVFVK